MPTTQLFVEILVIGIGAVSWIVLFTAAVLGLPLTDETLDLGAKELLPLVAVAYVVGIIVDRIVRSISERITKAESLEDAERLICDRSERLWSTCTYNRSRLRICRAWTLNFVLIGVGYTAWNASVGQHPPIAAGISVAAGIVLGILSAWATVQLSRDYKRQVEGVSAFLIKQKNEDQKNDKGPCSPPPT